LNPLENKHILRQLSNAHLSLFWFRRDLRLEDNAGLFHALNNATQVLGIFIFDEHILSKLSNRSDRRVHFIHQSLRHLKEQLERYGSSLLVLHGNPVDIFKDAKVEAVYTNHDYEPYARQRDTRVHTILIEKGIPLYTFKDQVIFEKEEVLKDDGTPYTVFTPYSRKWKKRLEAEGIPSFDTLSLVAKLHPISPLPMPSLEDIGFVASDGRFPERIIRAGIIENYHTTRNYPALAGTTRLSVHLRFGTVSIRKLATLAQKKNETWLNELIWRDFYAMILWHFPQVVEKAFKPAYDRISWRTSKEDFDAWSGGMTGYPIVDAGMRELNATGFMHNRVRMIVASFLTKHLLIDWRWGEAYFAEKLLDFDLASNNGGWQWAAGSGCDAAPYFRIFNPEAQTQKFDPETKYIKKWVPEWGTPAYPQPMVEHAKARQRALEVYKAGLHTRALQ
jgi:deoxyribodipyrimidine photo-lyase